MPHFLPGPGKKAGAHDRVLPFLVRMNKVADHRGVFIGKVAVQHFDKGLFSIPVPPFWVPSQDGGNIALKRDV